MHRFRLRLLPTPDMNSVGDRFANRMDAGSGMYFREGQAEMSDLRQI
jgi:hypothetical protein